MDTVPPARPLRVLVADDNRDAADSLRVLLELWGHEVLVAYDGRTALQAALTHRPDVLLLDIRMPEIHGAQVAAWLRRQPGLHNVHIIATSATDRHDARLEGYDWVFDDYLIKPYSLDQLERLLAIFASQAKS